MGARHSTVRRNAAETIGVMGDEKAVDSFVAVLKDDNRCESSAQMGHIWDYC
jgi:HEAT repeat protein